MPRKFIALAVAVVAALAASAGTTGTQQSVAGAVAANDPWAGPLVPRSGVLLGQWIRRDYSSKAAIQGAIEQREAALGQKLGIDQHFYPFAAPFPSWEAPWDIANGRIPLISWGGTNTWEVARGDFDTMIRARARAVRDLGAPVFMRWMWEPEASFNASRIHTPQDYIAAYRRIVQLFDAEGATNVTWAWCGTAWGMKSPDSAQSTAGSAYKYYPGDDVVDWVCADGFNWAPGRTGDQWRDWTWIFDGAHAFAVAHNKPMMVAAFGVQERDAGEKAAWMNDARAAIKTSFPNIKAVVYYDENKLYDWRIDTSNSSLNAFKDWANDPYFRSSVGVPPPVGASLLVDAFDDGDISDWSGSHSSVLAGSGGTSTTGKLRIATTAGRGFVNHAFADHPGVSVTAGVDIVSPAPNSVVPLLSVLDASDEPIARVVRAKDGRVGFINGRTGSRVYSDVVLPLGSWGRVRLDVAVAGPLSSVRVFVGGVELGALAVTNIDLGTSPAAKVELGDRGGQLLPKSYDLRFDQVEVTST